MDKKGSKTSSKSIKVEEIEDIEEFDDDISEEVIKSSPKKTTQKNTKKKSTKKSSKSKKEEFGDNKVSLGAKIACVVVIAVIIILLLLKGCEEEKEYTVKFDTNGGTSVSEQVVSEDGTVNVPNAPTKEGYEFLGWYLGDEKFDFDTKVTSDIKLEAKWNLVYTAAVTGITLDQSKLSLLPNDSATLVATVSPSDAKDSSVTWTSSNTSVATVDSKGKVTAIKEGKATITVTTKDGGFVATCIVEVTNDVVKVESVSVNKTNISLGIGEEAIIKATVKPEDATNKAVIWEIKDKQIASISSSGVVTGKKAGNTTVTVTTKDGNYKATIKVEVKKNRC